MTDIGKENVESLTTTTPSATTKATPVVEPLTFTPANVLGSKDLNVAPAPVQEINNSKLKLEVVTPVIKDTSVAHVENVTGITEVKEVENVSEPVVEEKIEVENASVDTPAEEKIENVEIQVLDSDENTEETDTIEVEIDVKTGVTDVQDVRTETEEVREVTPVEQELVEVETPKLETETDAVTEENTEVETTPEVDLTTPETIETEEVVEKVAPVQVQIEEVTQTPSQTINLNDSLEDKVESVEASPAKEKLTNLMEEPVAEEPEVEVEEVPLRISDCIGVSKSVIFFQNGFPGQILEESFEVYNKINKEIKYKVHLKIDNDEFSELEEYVFSMRRTGGYDYNDKYLIMQSPWVKSTYKVAVKIPNVMKTRRITGSLEIYGDAFIGKINVRIVSPVSSTPFLP